MEAESRVIFHLTRGEGNFPAKQTVRIQSAKIICSPRRDLGEEILGAGRKLCKVQLLHGLNQITALSVLREVSTCTYILENKITDVLSKFNPKLGAKSQPHKRQKY